MEAKERKFRKLKVGTVVSNKMDKTGIITVVENVRHPKYGKYLKKTSKFVFHDEKNEVKMGDTVKIMETRPLSKTKKWRLIEIIKPSQEKN